MKTEKITMCIFLIIAIIAVLFSIAYDREGLRGDASSITHSQERETTEEESTTISYNPHIDLFHKNGIKTFEDYHKVLSDKEYRELLALNNKYLKLDDENKKLLANGGIIIQPSPIPWDWFRGRYNYDKARRWPCDDELGSWNDYKSWVETFYNGNLFSNGWNYYENKWLNTDLAGGDAGLHQQIDNLLEEKGKRIAGDFAFKKPKIATIFWGQAQLNALEQIATGTVGAQPIAGGGTISGDYADMKAKQQDFKDKLDAINTAMTQGGVPPNNDPGIVSTSVDPGPC